MVSNGSSLVPGSAILNTSLMANSGDVVSHTRPSSHNPALVEFTRDAAGKSFLDRIDPGHSDTNAQHPNPSVDLESGGKLNSPAKEADSDSSDIDMVSRNPDLVSYSQLETDLSEKLAPYIKENTWLFPRNVFLEGNSQVTYQDTNKGSNQDTNKGNNQDTNKGTYQDTNKGTYQDTNQSSYHSRAQTANAYMASDKSEEDFVNGKIGTATEQSSFDNSFNGQNVVKLEETGRTVSEYEVPVDDDSRGKQTLTIKGKKHPQFTSEK